MDKPNRNRVLFMMPNWSAPSEIWMQRMMEELGDELGAVAVCDTEGAINWRSRVPAVSLGHTVRPLRNDRHILGSFGFARSRGESSQQEILLRTIKRLDVTHILCHYGEFAANFKDVWALVGTPLFIHFHGYDATFDLRRDGQPDKRHFPNSYLEDIKHLVNRATLIANSEFTRSLLLDAGLPEDQVAVKYLGVPVPDTIKSHEKTENIRLLHLGRLVDFKSPDRTIMAFEIAKANGLQGQLILAGDGPMRLTCELLRQRSPCRDSIQILGEVNSTQAHNLLSEADIFTQHNIRGEISRQSECFGVSIVEAMAMGLPVVGTRSGGVRETVVDGETGLLVDPGNVEAQAAAFLRLASDAGLRQKFGNAGHIRVKNSFSMDIERSQLLSIMALSTK